ncbi:MAG: phage tail tape measure C-terminal domain-containing protein [Melioribacteraceae bacterium]
MIKLGEIFVSLKLDYSQYASDLKKQEQAALTSAQRIEKANVSSNQKIVQSQVDSGSKQLSAYDKFIADKDRLTQRSAAAMIATQDKAAAAIMSNNVRQDALLRKVSDDYTSYDAKAQYTRTQLAQKAAAAQLQIDEKLNASILASKKALNQQRLKEESAAAKGDETSFFAKNVEALTKRILVTSAALTIFYGSMRAIRAEFMAGLAAVEDYELKVASMSAFLTTFSKNLTKTNASEVYRQSNAEAQKLVQTMEILDARTIASGKDLTTMAEQFIKGGIKIDTQNKAAMDGFVNIANALKLLTKGQNQEIQMRQEIRALSQGQVRDQNILVQTLKGIDPQIKEHIKLWKQQGTVLENVGILLKGFGPAAKDLGNTWAVVGSTMETIHNRVLRDAFRPTYESLIESAKAWNAMLMNVDGTLTNFAKTLSFVIGFISKFVENFVTMVAIITPIAAIVGLIAAAFGVLNFAISALTITMLANPLTAGLVVVTMALTAKTVYDLAKSQDSLNDKTKELTNSTYGLNQEINKTGSSSKNNGLLAFLDEATKKASTLYTELNKLKGIDVRGIGGMDKPQVPLISRDVSLTSGTQTAQLATARGEVDKEELDNGIESLKKLKLQLSDQNALYEKNNESSMKYRLSLGDLAKTIRDLESTGQKTTADAWKRSLLMEARTKDELEARTKANKDAVSAQEKADRDRIQSLERYEDLKRSLYKEEKDRLEKSSKTADDYFGKLQNKLESLEASPGETEQLLNWEDKFTEAMFAAGNSVSITSEELDKLYEKMAKFDETMGKTKAKLGQKEVKDSNIRTDKLMEQIFPNQKRELKGETLKDKLDKEKALWNTYTEEQKKLSEMTEEDWTKAYDGIAAQQDTFFNGARDGFDKYATNTTSAFKTASDSVQRAFKGMEDALVEFVKTGKISFTDMVDSMVNDLIRYQVQQSITTPLAEGSSSLLGLAGAAIASYFGGGGGGTPEAFSQVSSYDSMVGTSQPFSMGSANGNIFNQSGFQKFANGGAFTNSVVSKPTIFPFANGVGLMGEAGPEAIMPLKRTSSGALGVVSEGGGAVTNVIINNNTSATATTSETQNSSGGKDITVMIDEVVGNLIMSGRGKTNKAMRSTFGANPILAGR